MSQQEPERLIDWLGFGVGVGVGGGGGEVKEPLQI